MSSAADSTVKRHPYIPDLENMELTGVMNRKKLCFGQHVSMLMLDVFVVQDGKGSNQAIECARQGNYLTAYGGIYAQDRRVVL